MRWARQGCWAGLVLVGSLGCSIAPRDFLGLGDAAPLVRARAAGMGEHLPESMVIPALIDRLNDTDPVVRLSANEQLKKRTGQDFGFVPWADPPDRAKAVARWKAWNSARRAGLEQLPELPTHVSTPRTTDVPRPRRALRAAR